DGLSVSTVRADATARTVKSDSIAGRQNAEEHADAETHACTDDFTQLRDGQSGVRRRHSRVRAGGLANALCPVRGETRASLPARSLQSRIPSPHFLCT